MLRGQVHLSFGVLAMKIAGGPFIAAIVGVTVSLPLHVSAQEQRSSAEVFAQTQNLVQVNSRLRTSASGHGESTAATARNPAAPRVPLEFEANKGQAPATYRFVAHGPSYSLGLSATEIGLLLYRQRSRTESTIGSFASEEAQAHAVERSQIQVKLVGGNEQASVSGLEPRPGVSNYFTGNDPSNWKTHVPHFGRVEIGGAYPGIDLVLYGNPQQLEYDFRIAPDADLSKIHLQMTGVTSTVLDDDGNLILGTTTGDVELKHPDAYQEIQGARRLVTSRFKLRADNSVEFSVGPYDHSQPLVIDPVLLYAVSIGGSNGNQAIGLDVDAAGDAYVTGSTCSSDFPSTAGNFGTTNTNIQMPYCQDAFVLKLDPSASTLLYSDYIGGSVAQSGTHIAVDASGDAYVTGMTGSNNFPIVNNIGTASPVPCSLTKSGFNCAVGFIFKLNPDGSQLVFSSLLGGSQSAGGFQVKLNPATGDLLVLGETDSADFKPAPTTLQTAYSGGSCANSAPCMNAFLLGLNPTTGTLKYGTFFGASTYLVLVGLATDAGGDIYVTGSANGTLSSSLGAVTQTYAPSGTSAGGADLLVARLHLSGSTLTTVYTTLIQGELDDGGADIAVDASQNAYVIGSTASLHLPVTTGAYQNTNTNTGGNSCLWQGPLAPLLPTACGTGVVAKLSPAGKLSFLTYLGGNGQTWGQAIGVDSTGNIWLTGVTTASNFPFSADAYNLAGITTPGPFNPYNPFLAEMVNDGTTLPFASPIASSPGQSTSIKIDGSNNIYVTGFGTDAPSSPYVYPANPSAYNPGFVQKWNGGPQPVLQLSATSLTFPPTPYGGISASQTVTAQNTGAGAMELQLQLQPSQTNPGNPPRDFVETDNCGSSLAAGASCTMTVTFEPSPPASQCVASTGCYVNAPAGQVTIQTNTATGNQSVMLIGSTGQGPAISVIPNPIVFPAQNAGTTSSPLTVTLGSFGDLPFVLSSANIGGTNGSEFQITSLGSCTTGVPIGEIGCYVTVVFTPSAGATGTRNATLTLIDNAGDSPQVIPMTGTVTSSGAALVITGITNSQGGTDPLTTPLLIGSSIVGSTSTNTQVGINLRNPSTNTSVQVTSLSFGGTNAADFVASIYPFSLPYTIAPGGTLSVHVQFIPSSGSSGLRSATLAISTSPSVSGLSAIALTGDAVTATDGVLTYFSVPSPLDFGSLQIGQSSQSGQALLEIDAKQFPSYQCSPGATTSCGGPLTITSLGLGLNDYSLVVTKQSPYCTNPPLTIPAGGGCQVVVVFTPTAAGSRNTNLTINSNDPMGPTVIPLYGTGLALPIGDLSVSSLNFGSSAIGIASPPLTVTLQNIGQASLTVSSATTTAGYSVVSNTCTTVPPGGTCIIGVAIIPPAAGVYPGTLTITDNDYYTAQQVVALTGVGATGALLRITPSSISFGNRGLNTASTQQVSLVNTGSTTINFPSGGFRVDNPDYTLQNSTCGSTLAQGASCTLTIQFIPSSLYIDDGGLLITDNASGSPQPVYIQGFGTTAGGAATVTLTSSLNPSASGQPVTITATVVGAGGNSPIPSGSVMFIANAATSLGTAKLNASGVATVTTSSLAVGTTPISAIYSGDSNYNSSNATPLNQVVTATTKQTTTVSVSASPNPATTAQSVVLTATVTPAAGSAATPTGSVTFMDGTTTLGTGTLNGTLQASYTTSTLGAGTHSITAVYGGDTNFTGSTSALLSLAVNAPSMTTPTISVTPSSASITTAQSLTVAVGVNGGTGNPTPTGSVVLTGGGYTSAAAALSGGGATFTVPAGSLATAADILTVTYTPDTASSSIYNTASGTTTVTVATGTSATIALSNSGNVTISSPGQSGTSTISVTPSGGFTGSVALSAAITSSPTGAQDIPTLSFGSASPVNITSASSGTAMLTVSTTASTLASLRYPGGSQTSRYSAIGGAAMAFMMLLFLQRRNARNLLGMLAFLLLLAGGMMGCGGSTGNGGGNTGSPGTTVGSYTVTITGTSGSTTVQNTLTVTVN